jgi:NAD(P)-dependent dehydrogenase (short-subunit alcohol dehydrogenase family)
MEQAVRSARFESATIARLKNTAVANALAFLASLLPSCSSAKAGVIGLSKAIAKEWGRYAVTVNAVAFGYIQRRLTKPLQDGEDGTITVDGKQIKVGVQGGRLATINQVIPLGRGGTPEEAAGSVYLPVLRRRNDMPIGPFGRRRDTAHPGKGDLHRGDRSSPMIPARHQPII